MLRFSIFLFIPLLALTSSPAGNPHNVVVYHEDAWSKEIVLRSGAGAWDIGYARSLQRPDGKVVMIYYFNDHPDTERYIGATMWDPSTVR